jgi:hypothetical protein
MILKKIDGKIAITNIFADYILEQIGPKKDSIIRVVNLQNFVVVKGITTSTEVLDLTKIKDEFQKKFASRFEFNLFFKNTIDLIEYDTKLKQEDFFEHIYFNSDNPSFNQKQIEHLLKNNESNDFVNYVMKANEDDMVISSNFPHGFSIKTNRDLYYYFKKVINSIPSNYPWSSVKIKVSRNNIEETLEVSDDNGEINKTLESFILDYFDFNLSKIQEKTTYDDFYKETLEPLSQSELLKKDNDDYVII